MISRYCLCCSSHSSLIVSTSVPVWLYQPSSKTVKVWKLEISINDYVRTGWTLGPTSSVNYIWLSVDTHTVCAELDEARWHHPSTPLRMNEVYGY